MKKLKTILCSIYPILIILLLLANAKGCAPRPSENVPTQTDEPLDTADAVREAERVGQNGALKVTLLWNFDGDIDLHVRQPNGEEIYYGNKEDESTGGELDVDNQRGGSGSAENIYWPEPPNGEYSIYLVYYAASKSTGYAGSGTCTVVVFQEGKTPQTYKAEMSSINETKAITKILIR